ncbi:uncharacterized protein LOC131048178 [Cryptomeria japonica]|uniref:uncharacterized protein LOC131048178 n=1 Tax=Cryptomeria japonica TaxID=3369 RepID=UPI0027DAA4DF|nr:uncharacterized protein LOC131048178 [Cryptomeria japonica]
MVSDNQSSFCMGERKIGDGVSGKQQLKSAGNVTDISSALTVVTTKSNTTTDKGGGMELLDNGEEGEDGHITPKSEKHKIPAMTFCPPPPLKRKPARKRRPAVPPGTLHIPSDFPDLDLLFGLDSKSTPQHKKKKQKN